METTTSFCTAGLRTLLLVLILWSSGRAQSSGPSNDSIGDGEASAVEQNPNPSSPVTESADVDSNRELRELENDWAVAAATNDPDRVSQFFDSRFLFVGAGGVLQNLEEHLEDFRSGRLKIQSVRVEDFTADVYQGFAVTNILAEVVGRFAERDISGTYRFMDTWSKGGDGWRAVARQQTRVANASSTERDAVESASPPGIVSEKRPDVVPMEVMEAPRNELPSQRLLRQKYLEDDPLSPEPLGSSPRNDSSPTAATASSSNCPAEIRSSNGRLDLTLDVDYHTATIGNDQVRLRMYNKCLVGPTLRVKAGDVMYITLNNRLPIESTTPHDMNGHHGWNTTNLHFHGSNA